MKETAMNVLPEVHEYEEGDDAFHDGDKPHPLLQEIPLDASEGGKNICVI